MSRVLLSASFSEDLLIRQTPGRSGRWGEIQYVTEPDSESVDGWVVYDNLRQPVSKMCPPKNTLLITGEPESLRRYRGRFTGQFGQVWTSHTSIVHPRVTIRNESQHWHYGLWPGKVHGRQLGFDELCELPKPKKKKLISVICSAKALTPDHRKRLDFVRMLQSHLGDSVDVFGRDIRSIEDKSEAIYDYKYHIVLENDHSDYFMTEKISDAFLGWSYPIYFGGTEAYHRFPLGSFTAIDIYKPEEALATIRSVIAAETYENSASHIAEAREVVLFKNNIFAMLSDYWQSNLETQTPRNVTLWPKSFRANLVLTEMTRVARQTFSRRVA